MKFKKINYLLTDGSVKAFRFNVIAEKDTMLCRILAVNIGLVRDFRKLFFKSMPVQFIYKQILVFILAFILACLNFPNVITLSTVTAEQVADKALDVMPWEVGQSVEYQIISMENTGGDNRYKFTLVGKEKVGEKIYFWERIDIYESNYYFGTTEFKKNITLLALVLPLNTNEFRSDPAQYISHGLFPTEALRLKIQIFDSQFIEVDPKTYFLHQDIIEKTPYSITPHAMGRINFSNMRISSSLEKISVPAGVFECQHIFVNTDMFKEYCDEGFDLWRSPKVPLLGIVKMEFSKTAYWEKWSYRNEPQKIKTVRDFFSYLFNRRISGRRRPDTHTVNLIGYNENYEIKK